MSHPVPEGGYVLCPDSDRVPSLNVPRSEKTSRQKRASSRVETLKPIPCYVLRELTFLPHKVQNEFVDQRLSGYSKEQRGEPVVPEPRQRDVRFSVHVQVSSKRPIVDSMPRVVYRLHLIISEGLWHVEMLRVGMCREKDRMRPAIRTADPTRKTNHYGHDKREALKGSDNSRRSPDSLCGTLYRSQFCQRNIQRRSKASLYEFTVGRHPFRELAPLPHRNLIWKYPIRLQRPERRISARAACEWAFEIRQLSDDAQPHAAFGDRYCAQPDIPEARRAGASLNVELVESVPLLLRCEPRPGDNMS